MTEPMALATGDARRFATFDSFGPMSGGNPELALTAQEEFVLL